MQRRAIPTLFTRLLVHISLARAGRENTIRDRGVSAYVRPRFDPAPTATYRPQRQCVCPAPLRTRSQPIPATWPSWTMPPVEWTGRALKLCNCARPHPRPVPRRRQVGSADVAAHLRQRRSGPPRRRALVAHGAGPPGGAVKPSVNASNCLNRSIVTRAHVPRRQLAFHICKSVLGGVQVLLGPKRARKSCQA